MNREPRKWVLLRAEYERLLSLRRLSTSCDALPNRDERRRPIKGLLAIVEAELTRELERAAE